jgi:hypothetical protein
MGERGTSSQVSVVFLATSGWRLKKGKRERELLLGGERRGEKYQPEPLERTLLSLLSNKGSRLH